MTVSVLVVDDDARFRKLASRMLVAMGLAVIGEAASVAAATEAATGLRPDAVLLDVGLPDGDGVALARILAALPWNPRVVLTSSDRDATTSGHALAAGAAGFVPKEELPSAALHGLLTGL
jgi:two-component system nitrate/nitrite response regulator NarL